MANTEQNKLIINIIRNTIKNSLCCHTHSYAHQEGLYNPSRKCAEVLKYKAIHFPRHLLQFATLRNERQSHLPLGDGWPPPGGRRSVSNPFNSPFQPNRVIRPQSTGSRNSPPKLGGVPRRGEGVCQNSQNSPFHLSPFPVLNGPKTAPKRLQDPM